MRAPTFAPPFGYARIKTVGSFDELLTTPFAHGVNALCWPRTLPQHGFGEIVDHLGDGEGVVSLNEARLNAFNLSVSGRDARDFLLADLELLRAQQLAPELNLIHAYPRDENAAVVPTDVYDFHVDSAPIDSATWLCTYHGEPSEGLRNEEAFRRTDLPITRTQLLEDYAGPDDAGFREFLRDHHYDLHYAPTPTAQPFSFGLGHLWRIAVEWPASPVPPCIHRAPAQLAGQPGRLLLIS